MTIKYKDEDKDLIVPVLQKISKKYQEYSSENKIKNLKLTKKFLDSQLKLFRLKSKESAKKAQIDTFIETLNDDYSTFVGERGVKLSGGQKQRIGLARTIYKDSDFIILDEFTSALDEFTENQIIKIINNFPKTKTIVIVSHRKNVLRICDDILEIKKGKIENILKREEYLN